jgi:hypothetical protein
MAYDAATGTVVLFGGYDDLPGIGIRATRASSDQVLACTRRIQMWRAQTACGVMNDG